MVFWDIAFIRLTQLSLGMKQFLGENDGRALPPMGGDTSGISDGSEYLVTK